MGLSRFSVFLVFLLAAPSSARAESRIGGLYAAAGKADITPDLSRETIWLAGYGASGRRAKGVRDHLYARAVVISDGRKTAALVAVDSIGLFHENVEAMRRRLGWTGGDKYLFVAATHDHSAPDTMGLWGRLPGVSGVDARYHEQVRRAVTDLVRDLSAHMEKADVTAARADVDPGGMCRDSRDPVVIDPELEAAQFRARDGRVLGTMVRWSCHPEVLGSSNRYVTADYPGALCTRIERETGGVCAYFSGTIGGLLTPAVGRSGDVESQFKAKDGLGEQVAGLALDALRRGEKLRGGKVSFDSRLVRLPVENSRYLMFLPSLVFGHRLYDEAGRELPRWKTYWLPLRHLLLFPLPARLRPWVETEVSLVRVGPIEILGIPGELFPELAIGGYDGRYRYGYPLVDPRNPNPPHLERVPQGPYLRDKVKAKYGFLIGLANDEVGYIIPEYDFQAARNRLMWPHPPGTHYEETNSIGSSAASILMKAFDELLAAQPK